MEIQSFDLPPNYQDIQLETLFRLPDQAESYLKTLRSATSKLSFIMQFAYCQTSFQFFTPSTYHHKHLLKAIRLRVALRSLTTIKKKTELEILKTKLSGSQLSRHRSEILLILDLNEIGAAELAELDSFTAAQARKQMGPESLLQLLVTEIRRRRWIVPPITILNDLINHHYSNEEQFQFDTVSRHLPEIGKAQLFSLLDEDNAGFCKLQTFKKINQSTGARALQLNAQLINQLMTLYNSCKPVITSLLLNDQAVAYYARWVLSTDNRDIRALVNPNKTCLYLLGFVIQQLYERQDAAVDGFIKNFVKYINRAKKDSEQRRLQHANRQAAALEFAKKTQMNVFTQLKQWIEVGQDTSMSVDIRLTKVLTGLIDLVVENNEGRDNKTNFDDTLLAVNPKILVYEALLENRHGIISNLSSTLKTLEFDEKSSNAQLYKAIHAFKRDDLPQTSFLKRAQTQLLDRHVGNRNQLHKIFLFEAVVLGLKSGSLNLKYGFVWRSLENLQGNDSDWRNKLEGWLMTYGMGRFRHFSDVRDTLTELQDKGLTQANENFDAKRNPYVVVTEKAKLKVKAYEADTKQNKPNTISELLYEVEKLSIQDVLRTIQKDYDFVQYFVPTRIRHVHRKGDEKLIMASLIALGCNIGPRSMVKCSEGVSEKSLLTTVEHWMTPDNLRRANNALLEAIDKLALSKVFQFDSRILHSSSDGQKISIDGESLMAARSFKYFGRDSGVARYPFVDEKNRMLNTFVFSASVREATYVLDGLVGNIGKVSQMHSTDTHGYTDAVFAASYLLGIRFVPRIKGIERLGLYGARSTKHYKQYGYAIRPTSKITWSIIEAHWDEILRLIITISSGKASASQLFRRLNSYSKSPLYAALNELGRIVRTIFIVEYVDDLDLRQRIQKQLNLGEQANSFFKSVFWARGHRLRVNHPGDAERYLLSAQLIQNSVVLWNYLYVSELLSKLPTAQEREAMVQNIQQGQMLAWRHVNFSGEFNFKQNKVLDFLFDVPRLERLELLPRQKRKIDLRNH